MIGVSNYKDLVSLLLQLFDNVLGSPDQYTSAIDNFQAALLGLVEYLGRLPVGADQYSGAIGHVV